MLAISLNSGSNGNCIYVEAAGRRLVFDAGISGKRAVERLEKVGRRMHDADALIISHDHRDHIMSAGIFQRKFGMPMYLTKKTLEASHSRCALGQLGEINHFVAGGSFQIGDVTIHTIPTTHDAADGCGFVVEAEGRRLGILTDLGEVFAGLGELISTLDAVILESNYDPDMLASGPYPYFLKARISGPAGHISNVESAMLVKKYGKGLKWICLAHLSQENNTPGLALQTHHSIHVRRSDLFLASRYKQSDPMEI